MAISIYAFAIREGSSSPVKHFPIIGAQKDVPITDEVGGDEGDGVGEWVRMRM